ncbi:PAS-domain containing protein, partial [Siccirubricoccus sp. KC 17139]
LDNVRHGISYFGPDHRLIAHNALAEALIGAGPMTPGMSLAELVRLQQLQGLLDEAAAGEQALGPDAMIDRSRSIRYLRETPDGRRLEVSSNPTPDGGFVVTHTDVTELVEAQAAAAQRAAVLQVMLDNMRHGIIYCDAGHRVVAANSLAAELGGHPPGSVVPGRRFEELIEQQVARRAYGSETEAVARMTGAIDRRKPARYTRPGTDGRVIEVTSDPTPDGGFVVTMSDITPLAEAERAAKERAATLQAMLDNIRHGIALFDAEGRVQVVNPVFLRLLDLPAEVMAPGRPMADFVNLMLERGEYGEGEAATAAARAMLGRDRTRPLRTTRTRPNGVAVETVSDPIPGGGWVITYTDVTEERRIRAELERAKDAAEAANLAKSRFLAAMSHELRTPLNAVIGFSEAFIAAPDAEQGLDYIRSIHEAGRHLLSLIDDILDVTRAETTGFLVTSTEVDLKALGEGAVRVIRAVTGAAGVELHAVLPPSLPRIKADELRMRQVLLNLLSNAVKFTPEGGHVTLYAERDPGGDLLVRVTDTGIGMKPEDIPRAFEPFTQLDSSLARRFPGSGLGLYLSKALAEAQGATLTLESTPGQGSTALLRIPQALVLDPLAA